MTTDGTDHRRLKRLLATAGVLAVIVLIIWWPERRQFPPATSPANLAFIKQLYTVCNARDEERLGQLEQQLARAASEGSLSAVEQKAFDRIVNLARKGQWTEAEEAAMRFARDQVRR